MYHNEGVIAQTLKLKNCFRKVTVQIWQQVTDMHQQRTYVIAKQQPSPLSSWIVAKLD